MNITDKIICITKDWLCYSIEKDGKKELIKKPNTLTLEKIRVQLKKINFENFYRSIGGEKAKNKLLENRTIPFFAPIFYLEFIKNEKFATPQEIINIYLSLYCEEAPNSKPNLKLYRIKPQHMKNGSTFSFTYEQLAGRICRAYNSYIREVDLNIRLLQRKDIKVIYSSKWDIEEGVDILVIYNNCLKGIACCQDSKRSDEYFKEKHETRRTDKISIYKFPISRKNCIVIGDTWLYSDKAIENLIEEMKEDMDNE